MPAICPARAARHWPDDRRDLVFVHMPKTGGSWTLNVMHRRGAKVNDDHDPAWSLSDELRSQFVFGVVRDPWSWYASLYRHIERGSGRHWLEVWGRGSREWPDVLRGFLNPPPDVRPGIMPGIVNLQGRTLTRERFLQSGVGLWSWALTYFYGSRETWGRVEGHRWGVDRLLSTATLTEQLGALLGEDLQPEVGKGANRATDHSAHVQPYDQLYDAEQLAEVAAADATGLAWLQIDGPRAPIGIEATGLRGTEPPSSAVVPRHWPGLSGWLRSVS